MREAKLNLQTSSVKFPRSSVILFQGEVPRSGFLVNDGYIKVYSIDDDGNHKVVGLYSKGDIFPAYWLAGASSSVMFYHESIEEVSLTPIQKQDTAEESFKIYLAEFLAREAKSSLVRNLALQQSIAVNKILYFFYYLAVRHGQEKSSGLFSLGIPLTHQLIADNLGLTRETVASLVNKLKKDGIVVYRNKKYLVDRQLLISTVGKEINSNFVN